MLLFVLICQLPRREVHKSAVVLSRLGIFLDEEEGLLWSYIPTWSLDQYFCFQVFQIDQVQRLIAVADEERELIFVEAR